MTNYINLYTYDANGKSEPHDEDIDDLCDWLSSHSDNDETVKVSMVEFNEDDRVVFAWDVTKKLAVKLADVWYNSETVMTENPHPLAETIKNFSIDWSRYSLRNGG